VNSVTGRRMLRSGRSRLSDIGIESRPAWDRRIEWSSLGRDGRFG